jgi:hypothetical protein
VLAQTGLDIANAKTMADATVRKTVTVKNRNRTYLINEQS